MNFSHRYLAWISALLIALSLLGCASDRSVGTRVDDQAIETRVKAALLGAPDVKGTAISVEVRKGEVMLSGFVDSQAEAQRAVELARRVDGVMGVMNKMSIRR